MTSSTPTINAATDGMITSTNAEPGTTDPVADLRTQEAHGLISLACDAVRATMDLAHEIHTHVYKPDGTSAAESQRKLLAALTCIQTADHYLRMLDEVLADVPDPSSPRDADTGDPWTQ